MEKEYWDGSFATSRNNTETLEEDILNNINYGDVYAREMPGGGTERMQQGPDGTAYLHVYTSNPDSEKGHDHHGVDSNGRTW